MKKNFKPQSLLDFCAISLMVAFLFCSCSHNPDVGKKVLRIPLKDHVRTLDPTNIYDSISAEVAQQFYETPLEYNYFSKKTELKPALLDRMPEITKDGLTYILHLKKGVFYQDDFCFSQGKKISTREVVADDFIYSWKRHANPRNESQAFWIWDGKVKGINEFQKSFREKEKFTDVMKIDVPGFKALDKYTIQINLIKPYPQLIYILAMTFTSPVPQEAVEFYGKDFGLHPIGTGPFKLKEFNPTSRVVVERNLNFRDKKNIPYVDEIEFEIIKEDQPRWLGFMSGRYDVVQIPKDNFDSAIEDTGGSSLKLRSDLSKKGIYLSTEASNAFWFIGFNFRDKLIGSNKFLRRAIALAIDQKEWLIKFKNNRGAVQTEVSPLKITERCRSRYRWSFDLEAAKKNLEMAGYPAGKGLPTLTLDLRGNSLSERQHGEFIQKSLRKIGIEVEVIVNTFPSFLEKQKNGNLQLYKGGWEMDYPDPENNYQLLYSMNQSPGPNASNFVSHEFDKIFEKMSQLSPGPNRLKLICQLEKIIQEEVPWAYGIYQDDYRLAQSRVLNYHADEMVFTKWKFVNIKN